MEDEQDLFDKLIQIKDSYEPDPDLANKVIERINQREATVASKEPAPKWFWFALVGIIVAAAVVFLSVYLTRADFKITIYSAESIEFEDIEDLNSFISVNDLDFKCFTDKFAKNSIAKIKDTDTFAYVTQIFDDIGETGFDKIELKIVLLQNAEFEFYSSFESLNDEITVEDIIINYSIYERTDSKSFLAKFVYGINSYFLEIRTNDSSTAVLEKYVSQLLNQN